MTDEYSMNNTITNSINITLYTQSIFTEYPIINSIGQNLSQDIAIIEDENIGNNSNMIITYLFLVQNQTILTYEIICPVQSQHENPQTDIYISEIQVSDFN